MMVNKTVVRKQVIAEGLIIAIALVLADIISIFTKDELSSKVISFGVI